MNSKERRIAIAEACGWILCKTTDEFPGDLSWHNYYGKTVWKHPKLGYASWKAVPDYPNDLNACHEFEKMLDEQTYRLFIGHLVAILKPGEFAVRATAPQRCEAFLRTIGKWKEA